MMSSPKNSKWDRERCTAKKGEATRITSEYSSFIRSKSWG
eukprot:CAMPEP_0114056326 /NCGR_PEP_ID=MMETSP1339-20121228/90902_1 /TAXON_ID=94617 /ORGANISM="Fibrocapsa japonica" /LENGTH=39 /assembly_acc=CAM_ASM_000762